MKLGVFTPVFGTLTLDDVLAKVRALKHIQAIELGTGGWPGQRSSRHRRAARRKPCAAEYRKKIADAGLTISALSCHGNPLHPDAATAKADDDVLAQDRAARRAARSPGRRHVLRMSGRLRGREAPELGDDAVAAGVSRHPRVAVGEEGDSVLEPARRSSPADHGVKVALEAHPGFVVYNVESALRLREADGPEPRRQLRSEPFLLAGRRRARRRSARSATSIFHVHAKDVALDPHNVAVNGVIDTKTYRRMAERSWLFRSVGWGHDELEWKRIVSALRLAGYDYVMSIEHEDALASVDEGLRAAVDLPVARDSHRAAGPSVVDVGLRQLRT